MDAEVDWCKYFYAIKNICPWSYAAYKKGAIDFIQWRGTIFSLGQYEARIYLAPRHKFRQLKKMSNRFNNERPDEEWLWSHPVFGNNSTPVPCFIQQDRKRLENARLLYQKNVSV